MHQQNGRSVSRVAAAMGRTFHQVLLLQLLRFFVLAALLELSGVCFGVSVRGVRGRSGRANSNAPVSNERAAPGPSRQCDLGANTRAASVEARRPAGAGAAWLRAAVRAVTRQVASRPDRWQKSRATLGCSAHLRRRPPPPPPRPPGPRRRSACRPQRQAAPGEPPHPPPRPPPPPPRCRPRRCPQPRRPRRQTEQQPAWSERARVSPAGPEKEARAHTGSSSSASSASSAAAGADTTSPARLRRDSSLGTASGAACSSSSSLSLSSPPARTRITTPSSSDSIADHTGLRRAQKFCRTGAPAVRQSECPSVVVLRRRRCAHTCAQSEVANASAPRHAMA